MARRKAPRRGCQGASKGSLGNKADRQPAGEAAGPSRCQTSRYEVGCSCLGCQVGVVAGPAAASSLPLLPLQACEAKDGERRGGTPGSRPAVLPSLAATGMSPGRLPEADLWQGPRLTQRGDGGQQAFLFSLLQEPLHGGGAGGTLFAVNSQLSRSRACKVAQEGHRSCK